VVELGLQLGFKLGVVHASTACCCNPFNASPLSTESMVQVGGDHLPLRTTCCYNPSNASPSSAGGLDLKYNLIRRSMLCHPAPIYRAHVDGRPLPTFTVFGRNLQRQPVRKVNTREECHWSHACSLLASRRRNQWHPRA
jgi:hypothetical protein